MARVLKQYYALRALYETEGVDHVDAWGERFVVHDLLRGIDELPMRMRQAVFYMCIEDLTQVEAALAMGLGSTSASAIGKYRRLGLQRIIDRHWQE